tara:strand:- start:420 stop:869 length:450 start_codon:yes stop_codon:yes gene_type:complete
MAKAIITQTFTLVAGEIFSVINGYGVGYLGQWFGTIDGAANASGDETLYLLNGYGLNMLIVDATNNLTIAVNEDTGVEKYPALGDLIPFIGFSIDGVYYPIDQTIVIASVSGGVAAYGPIADIPALVDAQSYELIFHYRDLVGMSVSRT